MKRNTKIALVMMALSAMAMGSTSAFAHGGHGMWQQNAAPLTSEQQTAWQKILRSKQRTATATGDEAL